MARVLAGGTARIGFALVIVLVALGFAVLAYVRPGGLESAASPSPTHVANASAAPTSSGDPEPSPTGKLDPSATTSTTPGPDDVVVEFTNSDGPDRRDDPHSNDFVMAAHGLATYAALWVDDNQRDYHLALTGDIDGAIASIGDLVPRGVTIYFYLAEHTNAEVCALRDAMYGDREALMRIGIALVSGGCRNALNRVSISMSPLNPDTLAYMEARYPGPVDYESTLAVALGPFEPPDPESVTLRAIDQEQFDGLLTCGWRPFPRLFEAAPVDIHADGPHLAALRAAMDIYVEVYGDLSDLPWMLAERDDFGATFIADRGDTLLEAPVFAADGEWVPGTVDQCSPTELTLGAGNASVYFDPAHPRPTPESTELHLLLEETACASGSSPASRLLPPVVRLGRAELEITISVRTVWGGCPSNPMLPVTVVLPGSLGDRELRGVSAAPRN